MRINDSKNYFNNTKVANNMYKFVDLTQDIYVSELGTNKSECSSKINFEANDLADLQSKITRFDLMVMDAAYTLLARGVSRFSLEMLANTMVGKEVSLDKQTSTKLIEIQKSINKLKKIYINIDYRDVANGIKSGLNDIDCIVNGSLMPVTTYYIQSKVKREIKVIYEVLKKPVLYVYAENLGRIISVSSHVLSIPGIREDTMFIAIKQELVKEIEIMKNKNNKYVSRDIMYEWEHGDRRGGFAERVGLYKENYANEAQWKKRKVKLTDQIEIVLCHLISINYIKGYQFLKNGKSIIGVRIEL